MAIVKAFLHGRGRHSKGWDGYILCGEVNSEDDVFDRKTCEFFTNLRNYYVTLKYVPTSEELTSIISDKIAIHKDLIDNPLLKIIDRDATIQRFIDEGILPASTDIQTADQLPNELQDQIIALIKTPTIVVTRDATIQRFIDEGILPEDTEIKTADQLPEEMQDQIISLIKGGT